MVELIRRLCISIINAYRENIVNKCREKGVVIGGCGESAIRFRPALIFEPRHAEIMLETMNDVVGSMHI